MNPDASVLPTEGLGAPPRANGELVFDAPWQSRIFGITLALLEAGRFEWPEFQRCLIDAISRHESALGAAGEYRYYDCWMEAFCELADAKGWIGRDALGALERELEARPGGHDH